MYRLKNSALAAMTILAAGCTSNVEPSTGNAFGSDSLIDEIIATGDTPSMGFAYNGDTLVAINLWDEYNYWEPTTFEYGELSAEGKKYDVRMTCNSGAVGSEALPTDFYFSIGANGFANAACQIDRHGNGEVNSSQWTFEYNDAGQLVAYTYASDAYNVTGTLTWTDGDLTMAERRSSVGASTIYDKVALYYISSQEANPIGNRGGINVYDGTYGVTLNSVISSAYYAGLLGRPTKHLPLMAVRGEGSETSRSNFRWMFNNDGYPASLAVTTPDSPRPMQSSFAWRGLAATVSAERQSAYEAVDSLYQLALSNPQEADALLSPELQQALSGNDRDVDPWTASSDNNQPRLIGVKVLACDSISARVRADVCPVASRPNEVNSVTLTCQRTPQGWMVTDFMESDGTSMRQAAMCDK